jgi:hypothetical protein
MTQHAVLECVAAVSSEFHGRREGYAKFYERHGAELGGFPAIWQYCLQLGLALHEAEEQVAKNGIIEGIDYDWVEVVLSYTDAALYVEEPLDVSQMGKLALDTITRIAKKGAP